MISLLLRRRSVTKVGSRRRKPRARVQVESLERKTLLTTIPIDFGATVASPPVAIGGNLFFAATDSSHGTQLWMSNGTSTGTVRLSDGNDS
ncbi:MAG: hypothetical protein ACYC61_28255, partial [Isosphaeraceae bacterium]